jgi:hypothetical protein
MNPSLISDERKSSRGMAAIGIFLLFGAVTAFLGGTSLVWHGTRLERIWALNPRAYRELAPLGKAVGISFLLLSVALIVAAVGWFKRRVWGWRLTVAIIATQVLGDLVNMIRGHVVEGGIGVVIAGGLLVYLLRANVRNTFGAGAQDK